MKRTEDNNFKNELNDIINTGNVSIGKFQEYVLEDAEAYNSVLDAYKLPKSTDEEKSARTEAVQKAFKHAAEVPLNVVEDSRKMLNFAMKMAESGNVNCLSDTKVAVSMLNTAITGGKINVEINMKYIKDEAYKTSAMEKLQKFVSEAEQIADKANKMIKQRFED